MRSKWYIESIRCKWIASKDIKDQFDLREVDKNDLELNFVDVKMIKRSYY